MLGHNWHMTYDVAVVGGGHNGLTSASYLAKAGLKVVVLERLDKFGGAAVSEKSFKGVEAKLSRYSYLVSLLPKQVIDDLGLEIELAPRRYSSYTPVPGSAVGLLVDNHDLANTQRSFDSIGAANDFSAWQNFYSRTQKLAKALFPSVTKPLPTRSEAKAQVEKSSGDSGLFDDFLSQPIGKTIENYFDNDLVKGVVLTDGLIGTFGANLDASMDVNKCFLYHVIGGETGDWNIPVGGMGQVSGALEKAARGFGAELIEGCEVTSISEDNRISFMQFGKPREIAAKYVLANVSPFELEKLTGVREIVPGFRTEPGSQVKVNLLLKRLPKLLDSSVDPKAAFGGTFHINETWSQLQIAFEQASNGEIPNPLPCEIYCHSLTDPSILSEDLQNSGAQTLTVFALHTPHSLLSGKDLNDMRSKLENAVIDSLNSVLAEDIRDLLLEDQDGNPCIETKTTQDLEDSLRLPGGNIFHGPLKWPFLEDDEPRDTASRRWGVATKRDRLLICGSGARRGGAVSGIAGHNAAMAVLEELGK